MIKYTKDQLELKSYIEKINKKHMDMVRANTDPKIMYCEVPEVIPFSELDKLAENIETGQAPYDQQQTLTLEFYKDRIAALELEVKEIRKDMMQMVHDMNGMKPPSHSGH